MLHIIGGKHKRRKIVAPKSIHVRPTAAQLREAVFNICQQKMEGARFLDLFAGSGAMGLEALSRGAAHATFIERGRPALEAIKQNIHALGEEDQTTVIPGDVLAQIPLLKTPFDIIYVDPPYGKGMGGRVLHALDTYPVLAEGGIILIEDVSLEAPALQHLELKQKRSYGRTTLFEYRTRLISENQNDKK